MEGNTELQQGNIMIYWLLIIFFVLTLFSFWAFNTDIINPGFVVPFVFFASTCCAIYNKKYWRFEIGEQTFWILTSGVFVYVVISLLTYKIGVHSRIKRKHNCSEIYYDIKLISVESYKVILLAAFQSAASVLYLREVMRIVTSNGGDASSFSAMLNSYKLLTHFQNIENGISGIVSQFYQLTAVIGLVFTYIVVNNVVGQKRLGRKLYLVPVMVYIVSIIFSGNRLSILRLAIICMVLYFILWHRKNGWTKKTKVAALVKTMLMTIIVLLAFVFLRSVVGKSGADANTDPLYYIAEYAGGSIPLFDLYVKNPVSHSDIFGKESLYYINQFIASYFGIDSLDYSFACEFRSSNGISMGNVYTAFRAYYSDFGYVGMLLCTAIHSFLFSLLYANIRKRTIHKKNLGIDIPLLLFSRMSYSYFFFSINNYTDWLSPNFVKLTVFLVVVVWFVRCKTITRGKDRVKRYIEKVGIINDQ